MAGGSSVGRGRLWLYGVGQGRMVAGHPVPRAAGW